MPNKVMVDAEQELQEGLQYIHSQATVLNRSLAQGLPKNDYRVVNLMKRLKKLHEAAVHHHLNAVTCIDILEPLERSNEFAQALIIELQMIAELAVHVMNRYRYVQQLSGLSDAEV